MIFLVIVVELPLSPEDRSDFGEGECHKVTIFYLCPGSDLPVCRLSAYHPIGTWMTPGSAPGIWGFP